MPALPSKAVGAFASRLSEPFSRSSVVVATGVSPAQAWDDFHSHEEPRLSAADVLDLASGLFPTDLLPDHINALLRHVESQAHPRERTRPSFGWYGSRAGSGGGSQGRVGLVSGVEVLPAPCLSCGCPSVLQCRRCACRDCRCS